MKICLIGGIYEKGGGRSEYVKVTPETTLEHGFREAGHDVTTLSHYDDVDFSGFDVVHVHHLSYGAARLAADRSATPFVFTAHDASHMSGTKLSIARRCAISYVLSRADAVVSLSQAEAEFQNHTYRLRGARRQTIPNGIDPDQYPYRRLNHSGQRQPWRLLFVGQLIPLKGVDLLLRAIATLPPDIELTLAYQTNALESDLRSLASQLGLTDRIKFIGKQNPRQLASLYQSHDLLLLPSETEALPSVITEAMLSGLPFVASAVGGVPEQSAGFGHLIKRRTVEDIAADIAQVLQHYSHYSDQGQPMSHYARQKFSIRAMVGAHLSLYRELAGHPARRTSSHSLPVDLLIRTAVHHWGCAGKPEVAQTPLTATERL